MRRKARVDGNQEDIAKALEAAGATVERKLARLGDGIPDLLVGFRKRTFLLEVKDGSRPPSERRLSDDEAKWHRRWRGQVAVVETPEAALAVIGAGR